MPNIENIGRRDAELGSSSELVDGIELADEVERLGLEKSNYAENSESWGRKCWRRWGLRIDTKRLWILLLRSRGEQVKSWLGRMRETE